MKTIGDKISGLCSDRPIQRFAVLSLAIAMVFSVPPAVAAQSGDTPAKKQIYGWVKSGDIPLPGVSVSALNAATGQQVVTSTDVDGSYALTVPDSGRYNVSAKFTAFSPAAKEVSIEDSGTSAQADFQMTLLSRAEAPPARRQFPREAGRNPGGDRTFTRRFPGQSPGQNPGQFPRGPQQRPQQAQGQPGFLNLPVMDEENAPEGAVDGERSNSESAGSENPGDSSMPDVSSESVSISGAAPRMEQLPSLPDLRDRGQEMMRYGGPGGGPGMLLGGGPPGGGGGPFMVFGGPGGFGGGGGRFNANRMRGNISYTLGDSAFDAKPYSLNGLALAKPSYVQNRFSATLGGPLNIPKIFHGGNSTFFFLSYDGGRSRNPFDSFSTVPTAAERLGDFSSAVVRSGPNAGTPVQIFDPQTHLPFLNSAIPAGRLSPAASRLIGFLPLPNLPGEVQNYHRVTSTESNSDNINLRVMHNSGGSGPAGRIGGRGARARQGSNINIGFRYRSGNNEYANASPFVGANTSTRGIDLSTGYVRTWNRFTNMALVDFNRNRVATENIYAFSRNVAGELGINGVSQNPFDYGLPNLSFTNFSGLRDVNPVLRRDQTLSFSDNMAWSRGKHTWRWGGDFRRIQLNTKTDANARGSFTFTGFSTAAVAGGASVPGTGYDLADFLLGLPQQTSAQFGANAYYFRGVSSNLFFQDEWRLSPTLTLNLGMRYEYVSPFTEKYNRIVNLDAAAGFAAVAPVLAGESGAYNGSFPATLVNPDRNNFAPRLGLAWKPLKNTIVRTGYGINYNTGAYSAMIQNLAFQPPFAFTQTNIQSPALPLTLENGFPAAPFSVTNNFGVDRNYRLGYVQMWNFDIQQQLPHGVMLNLDFTHTKGTRLDIQRAPNRGPLGLLISGVQPFLWESSEGNSTANSFTLRLRKRYQRGFMVGGSYVFAKSIDNASSIGGGATTVAQNDLDLSAERGLSSFDQRHRLTANYVWELPMGTDKRWLSGGGLLSSLAGGWQWSGSVTLASGTPFTAHVLGNFAEVGRGTNGTLRADATGLPVSIDNPTAALFFNPAAFAVPQPGQFGNAARNTIPGPRTVSFNMSMNKEIPLGDTRRLELRAQVTNLFNTPQFTAIDTTVNSPSYGRVLNVGSMRRIQFVARFRF